MALVAFWVALATTVGVVCELRTAWAGRAANRALGVMLYVLSPFVSYVGFAHLRLSIDAAAGLGVAYVGLGLAGTFTWLVGRRMRLTRAALGGLIVPVIIVNTGYLGFPMVVALLGQSALIHAIAYDQVVSGPMVFTVGFGVGAAFGSGEAFDLRERLRRFLTRNPPLVGALAGLLAPAGWAPHVLVGVSHAVVELMLVSGFFAVGVRLSSERREDGARLLELPDRRVLLALLARFTINPTLLILVSLAGVAVPAPYLLQAVMPSGIMSLVIGHAYGLDQRLIATVIVWGTLLAITVGTIVSLA